MEAIKRGGAAKYVFAFLAVGLALDLLNSPLIEV